uniref:Uncharacterized protein n=1 Tax=Echinococcus canadensis TaxID=519352 RepID=A0A915EYS7_9CEST
KGKPKCLHLPISSQQTYLSFYDPKYSQIITLNTTSTASFHVVDSESTFTNGSLYSRKNSKHTTKVKTTDRNGHKQISTSLLPSNHITAQRELHQYTLTALGYHDPHTQTSAANVYIVQPPNPCITNKPSRPETKLVLCNTGDKFESTSATPYFHRQSEDHYYIFKTQLLYYLKCRLKAITLLETIYQTTVYPNFGHLTSPFKNVNS